MEEVTFAKILVVDDDAYVLSSLRAVLQAEGYRVVTASRGADGLRLLREEQPDLVLLDVLMPDMDGWEVCRRMRVASTVPVIMLTACQGDEEWRRGQQVGADGYLVKPVPLEELCSRVQMTLRRAGNSGP
jgi:two-component system response regulator MprA